MAKRNEADSSYFEAIEMGGVLDRAKEIVDGRDKQSHYGTPEEFFPRLATAWTAYLRRKLRDDVEITAFDSAMLMATLKILRLGTDPDHADSLDDLAGYARIGERVK